MSSTADEVDPRESTLRALLRQVTSDAQLSGPEKSRRTQLLLSQFHRGETPNLDDFAEGVAATIAAAATATAAATAGTAAAITTDIATATAATAATAAAGPHENVLVAAAVADAAPTFCKDGMTHGCAHYQRSARMVAPCCGKVYTCRFCHDDDEMHEIDRHAVRRMVCMHCGTEQDCAQQCARADCARELARYYCDVCHFWDNDDTHSVYHCAQCGICRRGRGLGIDYFHCTKCNTCLAIGQRDEHKCIERLLDSNCPICGVFLFTSTEPVEFFPCGHPIHGSCRRQHLRVQYTCPTCSKAVGDALPVYANIALQMAAQPMPPSYMRARALVLCNECLAKTEVRYHFIGSKCGVCPSYNTQLISRTLPPEGSELPSDEEYIAYIEELREAELVARRLAFGDHGFGHGEQLEDDDDDEQHDDDGLDDSDDDDDDDEEEEEDYDEEEDEDEDLVGDQSNGVANGDGDEDNEDDLVDEVDDADVDDFDEVDHDDVDDEDIDRPDVDRDMDADRDDRDDTHPVE